MFGKKESEQVIEQMLAMGEMLLNDGMDERAFSTYKSIVELEANVTAQYNLGILYATGRGTKKDFLQAAYWFHQAALCGDKQAEKLRLKCMMDYVQEDFAEKTHQMLFDEMIRFAVTLYPREDKIEVAIDKMFVLAEYYLDKGDYTHALKLLRAAAECGDDGRAQNRLGVLYNAGIGVEKDDLAALYWFDRAADNRVGPAKIDRDGIFNAYRDNFSRAEFVTLMFKLGEYCAKGTDEIPRDGEKATYWRKIAEQS